MKTTTMTLLAAVGVIAAVLAPARAIAAAAPIDAAAVRKSAAPAVARVTVENSWGVQTAVATGFLIGDGRFVVTDLGAVARPGTAQVTLKFSDGTAAVAKQFAMAEPGLGLVALRVEGDAPARTGLALAPALPALDGSAQVAAAGWPWAGQLDVAAGRLWRGPLIKDMAARARVEPPPGVEAFVRLEGGRLDAASGSPLIDAAGTVLAVLLDLEAGPVKAPLAMPASTLREALLSSAPQLKPLAELPAPVWPVRVLRLPGEPTAADEFTRALQTFKAGLTCTLCKGKGKADPSDLGVRRRLLERMFDREITCPVCRGEGIAVPDGFAAAVATIAERGTRTVWAPAGDERARTAARTGGLDLVKTLSAAGPNFQRAAALAIAGDLLAHGQRMPHGTIIQAKVEEHLDGPDGRYIILDPWHSNILVAIRTADLAGRGAVATQKDVADGNWIMVAGTILSPFKVATQQGVFVLPFEWMPSVAPVAPAAAPPGPPGPGPGPGRKRGP